MANTIKRKRKAMSLNKKPEMVPELIESRSDLHALQEVMLQAISRELTPALNMKRKWTDGTPTSIIAQQFIKPNDRLTSFKRLEIYNRQYWFRLLDCLYDDFPGLRAVLGDAQFHKMSRAYLAQYPSRSFQLRNLGQQLETFLTLHPQWAGARLAMALDMAKFEWAQIEAFDAQALPVLEVNDLAGRNPAELRIKLQPYVSLLRLEYPLDEFAIALKKESPMHTEAAEGKQRKIAAKQVPLPEPERIFLVTHRFNNAVFFKRMQEPAFILLEFLDRGQPVQEAVGRALPPFFTADPARDWAGAIKSWFANWAELGWLCR